MPKYASPTAPLLRGLLFYGLIQQSFDILSYLQKGKIT